MNMVHLEFTVDEVRIILSRMAVAYREYGPLSSSEEIYAKLEDRPRVVREGYRRRLMTGFIQLTNSKGDGGFLIPSDSGLAIPMTHLTLYGNAFRPKDGDWLSPERVRVTSAGYDFQIPESATFVQFRPDEVLHLEMDAYDNISVREHPSAPRPPLWAIWA